MAVLSFVALTHSLPKMKRALTSVGLLVGTACVVRWAFCFVVFPSFPSLVALTAHGDRYAMDGYREIAANLLQGNGYRIEPGTAPVLNRPPGYVFALMLAGPNSPKPYVGFQLLNGLLGGISAWATWKLARLRKLPHFAALFAGYAVALWPYSIWGTKATLAENLLVALMPAVLCAFAVWQETDRARWLIILGLLTGATVLTHGLYQVLPFAIALAIVVTPRPAVRRAAAVGLFILTTGAVVVPWLVRNERIAGYPVGVATGMGYHYFIGLYAWEQLAAGKPYFSPQNDTAAKNRVKEMLQRAGFLPMGTVEFRNDPGVNRWLDSAARHDLVGRPVASAVRAAVRAPLYWVWQRTPKRTLLTVVLFSPFLILAGIGLACDWDRRFAGIGLVLVTVNVATAAVLIEGSGAMRYPLPLLPLVFVLSARGLTTAVRVRADA